MILGLHAIPELVSKESRRVANRHNCGGSKPAEGMYNTALVQQTVSSLDPILGSLMHTYQCVGEPGDEANTQSTCKHYILAGLSTYKLVMHRQSYPDFLHARHCLPTALSPSFRSSDTSL